MSPQTRDPIEAGPPAFHCPTWTSWELKVLREAGQGREYGAVFTRLASSPSLEVGSQSPYLHLTIFALTKTPFPFRGLSLPISTMGLQSLSQVCSLRRPFRVCFGKSPETVLRKSPGGLNPLLHHSHLAPSFLVPATSPQSPGLPSGSPHPQVDGGCGFCFSTDEGPHSPEELRLS